MLLNVCPAGCCLKPQCWLHSNSEAISISISFIKCFGILQDERCYVNVMHCIAFKTLITFFLLLHLSDKLIEDREHVMHFWAKAVFKKVNALLTELSSP